MEYQPVLMNHMLEKLQKDQHCNSYDLPVFVVAVCTTLTATVKEHGWPRREVVGVDGQVLKHRTFKPESGVCFPGETKEFHPGHACSLGACS